MIAAESTAVELPVAEVWARWPVLSPLLALDDPPYRFIIFASGVVVGIRDCGSYSDTIWFMEARAGGIRRQTPNRTGRRIEPEATTESVPEALALLLRPPRVVSEP